MEPVKVWATEEGSLESMKEECLEREIELSNIEDCSQTSSIQVKEEFLGPDVYDSSIVANEYEFAGFVKEEDDVEEPSIKEEALDERDMDISRNIRTPESRRKRKLSADRNEPEGKTNMESIKKGDTIGILSKRRKEKFSHDGYLYTFDKFSKSDSNVRFWKCEQVGRCKGRIHTRDRKVIKEVTKHSHDSSAVNVEVAVLMTKVKLIDECFQNLSQAAQASVPNNSAIRKIIRRRQNELNAAPADPLDLLQLSLPDMYKSYIPRSGEEENFLLADSGPGPDRILIFGRESWLQHLATADIWYADGTLSVAPSLFSQVYVVMAEKHEGLLPIFYALLANKQRVTYTRMFDLVRELEPNLSPRSIHCDYEPAAYFAMKKCFPAVEIKGCFFYLVQNMPKYLEEMGDIHAYNNDADFALRVKMIIALAFVPIADIDEYFDALANDLPAELQPLINWFKDNFMGRLERRGNGIRPPLFPPEMWNLYSRMLKGEDYVNNHAEVAHRRLHFELGVQQHPTIWKFIDGLHKSQKGRDDYFEQLLAGHGPPMKLKKYRNADEHIVKIISAYGNRLPLEYLRDLAHNF